MFGFVLLATCMHLFHVILPEGHRLSRQIFNLYCPKQIIADLGEVDKRARQKEPGLDFLVGAEDEANRFA